MKHVLVLVLVLNLATVLSLRAVTYKLREVSEKNIEGGVQHRIYGGLEAKEGQFPFMVFTMMMIDLFRVSQCSASLISPDFVLLAAHCVDFSSLSPRDIIVVGGKANLAGYVEERMSVNYYSPIEEQKLGLQERRAVAIHKHPGYDKNHQHDIAVLRLDAPFVLGRFVQTIPIAAEEMKTKKHCTILGWGLTRGSLQPYKLNFVENRRVSTTKLGCSFKPSGLFLCLLPDDSGICQGDSGSPLVCDGKVWGVASHFVSDTQDPDCGDSKEDYYSELHPDLRWLQSIPNIPREVVQPAPGSSCQTPIDFRFVFLSTFAAIFFLKV